ncbi:uncharacterized protein BJX67DRAFT_330053 [Aspergillus lucknowensis]|uniref:Uncharacterized protein n=1 Tax=Aspergillus lucknowensis TaxID=176173 RepID=A0ABR4L842_9EURO
MAKHIDKTTNSSINSKTIQKSPTMQLTLTTVAAILATCASTAHATTFHNNDQAYTISVEHSDGSSGFVGPGATTDISDGWAYIRACQQENAGGWFYCPPGVLTWPDWYGDVYWYMGGLTDASGAYPYRHADLFA